MNPTHGLSGDFSGSQPVNDLEDTSLKSIVYFPEPASQDESWQEWDETAVHWLARSTQPRALAIREFLNVNLGHFPPRNARKLAQRLNQDWQSFFFELVVGRYLQVLGAEVEYEPEGSNGTHVDYRATFPGGFIVSVECVSKRFNQGAQQTIERNGKLARMLADVGPTGWIIEFRQLPEANSVDEFQPYVENAKHFYSTLPEPTAHGRHFKFAWQGVSGHMELEAIPFPTGTMANHLGPAVTYMDDSIVRLKTALIDSHKRRQARGAVPPVFLAIDCPFNGPDAEDFDQALFGQTVDHRDSDSGVSLGTSFNPNGLLVIDKGIPFAGVLAFLRLSLAGASDPVLYLNPYQRWKLPAALASHRTRVWTSGIKVTGATREPIINQIRFVEEHQPL